MSWVAVGVAGVGLVSSFLGNKKAKKAEKRQRELQEQELALSREQLDWAKGTYEDWQTKFDPMYRSMVAEMDQDITPNYGMIAGDTKSAFQAARESNERNMMRYGASPLDGNMQAMNRDYGIREAASHVGNRAAARENAKGVLYSRKAGATNMLATMQGAPLGAVQGGYGDVSNSLNRQGEMVAQHGVNAQNRMTQWGNDAGAMVGGVDWQGLSQSAPQQAAPYSGLGDYGNNSPQQFYRG
jgi:hypothetical protein